MSGTRRQSLLYGLALFVVGVLYRATFISQGYNATDEGWLQSLGARIVAGQVPYRDFNFDLPPLSIYREAALIRLFGDSYGILASRWVFILEVSLAGVLAFLIVVRYVRPTLAFLTVLPTCFFSVILFYFANYSYDGEFLALLSIALLVHASTGRRLLAVLGGLAGGLAFAAKPTFLGLLPIVLLAAVVSNLAARRGGAEGRHATEISDGVGLYVLGFVASCLAVFGYFALEGAAGDLINYAFILPRQSYPIPLAFVILQDLPERMLFWPNIAGYIAAALVLLFFVRFERIPDMLRSAAATAIILVLVVRALPSSDTGLPNARQEAILLVVLGTLLLIDVAALATSIVATGRLKAQLPPPELPLMALGMQYVAQFKAAGVSYSYYGAFLSVPVAILFAHAILREGPLRPRRGLSIRSAPWTPALLALAIVSAGVVDMHGAVFRDGSRAQLTATFHTPLLHGLWSRPENTARLDALVAAVDSRTSPGDPILVMPDLPGLYFLTGRRNATRIGWYETPQVTVGLAEQAVADMRRNPPKLVVLQTYDEGDFRQAGPQLNYGAIPQLEPVYSYVVDNYSLVDTVGDLQIYEPAAPRS